MYPTWWICARRGIPIRSGSRCIFCNYLSSSGKCSVVQKSITQTKWIFCTKIITNKLGKLPMHSYGSGAVNTTKTRTKLKYHVTYCYNRKGRYLGTVPVLWRNLVKVRTGKGTITQLLQNGFIQEYCMVHNRYPYRLGTVSTQFTKKENFSAWQINTIFLTQTLHLIWRFFKALPGCYRYQPNESHQESGLTKIHCLALMVRSTNFMVRGQAIISFFKMRHI